MTLVQLSCNSSYWCLFLKSIEQCYNYENKQIKVQYFAHNDCFVQLLSPAIHNQTLKIYLPSNHICHLKQMIIKKCTIRKQSFCRGVGGDKLAPFQKKCHDKKYSLWQQIGVAFLCGRCIGPLLLLRYVTPNQCNGRP